MLYKKSYIVLLVLVCVFAPVFSYYYSGGKIFIFHKFFFAYLIVPYLLSVLVYRSFFALGLKIANVRAGMATMFILAILYLPFFFIFISNEIVIQSYGKITSRDFLFSQQQNFLELFPTEYFFRGFLLFSLQRHFDDMEAILLQGVLYTILHIGKPFIECIGSFPVGLALGYLAIRTGSIWYGVLLHYLYGGLLLDIWRLRLS